jgi:MFS family permease
LREWLVKFLQQGHGYGETETLVFNSFWYATTDVGCLGAGALAVWLARRGKDVVRARLMTFFVCAAMSLVTLSLPWMESQSWLQLAVLLIAGAGALGVFPIYHAFTQDISREHQGKITGIAGVAGWALAPAHQWFGKYIDEQGSFDQGFAVVGTLPFVAFLILALFWPRTDHS